MNIVNINKAIRYFKKNGIKNTVYACIERIAQNKTDTYQYQAPEQEELDRQRIESSLFKTKLSVVVPAYETKEEYLSDLFHSLLSQSYQNWELVLVDASVTDRVFEQTEQFRAQFGEDRLQYIRISENQGISENTNVGILKATGDYICLADHDDCFTLDALYHMAKAVESADLAPALIYSDEDKADGEMKQFYDRNDKYDFDYDLILSNNYICHITMVQADLMKELLERGEYNGAQDFDLVLRVMEWLEQGGVNEDKLAEHILHVPRVLYHWRCHAESTAQNTDSKLYAYEAGKAAVQSYLNRKKIEAEVTHSLHLGFYKVQYRKDFFAVRKSVGMMGGKVLDGTDRMLPVVKKDGQILYAGLHRHFSGRMHRFSLTQSADYVDIRCMRLSEEMRSLTDKLWDFPYRDDADGFFAYRELAAHLRKNGTFTTWEELSKKLCDEVRRAGKTIVFYPEYERKVWTFK